jgi:uncharacterized protein (DUF58 family)
MAPSPVPEPRRRSFRLTWPGRLWIVAAVALLALGLGKNINLLALLGYFLLVVAAFNVLLAGRGLPSLVARRRHRDPVFAGQRCLLEVSVTGRRVCPGVFLEERGRDHHLSWLSARVGGKVERTFRGEVVLPRRGRYERGPLWAVSGYPFGLAERRVRLAPAEELLVLPRLGSLRRGGLRRQLRGVDPTGDRQRRRPPHPAAHGEVHGLRQFRTGDSPRTIHWKTSARRGELMVREFEDASGDSLLLVLDPALPDRPDAAERFEDAVSLAATLAREWCRGGAERLVLAVAGPQPLLLDGIAGPGLVFRTLQYLAEAVPGGDAAELLDRLAGLPNLPAAIVVVSAGPGALSGQLTRQARRPVTSLDVTDTASLDYYTPPGAGGDDASGASPIALHPPGT